jgi:hypothetical protein
MNSSITYENGINNAVDWLYVDSVTPHAGDSWAGNHYIQTIIQINTVVPTYAISLFSDGWTSDVGIPYSF